MERSESIIEIAKALGGFQGEVSNPSKNSVNPAFKSNYANLDEIINTIRPTLAKHGLSFLQTTKTEGEQVGVSTMILHTSGEFIQSDFIWIPLQKVSAHGVGAATTYGRRFSLGAMLGIAIDEDEDGNSISNTPNKPNNQQNYQSNTNTTPPQQNTNTGGSVASEKQVKLLHTLTTKYCEKAGYTEDQVKQSLTKIVGEFEMSYTKLNKGQASQAIAKLQELTN